MKKGIWILAVAGMLELAGVMTAYGAGWQWLDSNGDGVEECYYVQDDGTILTETVTPDGYTVNGEGAWVVDGVVQVKQKMAETPSVVINGSVKTSQVEAFEYELYVPKNAVADMHLIVYLHGHGQKGALKDDEIFRILSQGAEQGTPAYILAPRLPSIFDTEDADGWEDAEPSLMEIIETVVSTYQINRNCVSIIGSSMGASGLLPIVTAHPETFSCAVGIVPFSYHGKNPTVHWEKSWAETLKDIPVWMFVEDAAKTKSKAQEIADDIIAAGGQAWVEIQKNKNHSEAGQMVRQKMRSGEYDVYNWMVSKSK